MTTSARCRRHYLALAIASPVLVFGPLAADALADRFTSPDNPVWRTECGSCHVAYPPALLSAAQWRAQMASLARHYGTDASVDAAAAEQIGAFLERNAGRDRGIAMVGAEPPRITASAWFVRKHREVGASQWRSTAVKSAANCGACHGGAERGNFDEHAVRIPR
jgi:hypothetical protein